MVRSLLPFLLETVLVVLGIFQGLVVGRRSNLIYPMLPTEIEAAPYHLERPQALGRPTRRLESLARTA